MAGESFDAKARISIEVDAKDVDSLIDALAQIEDRASSTGKAVDKLERQLVNASSANQTASKAVSETARAQDQVAKSTENATGNIITQRYALYDVARTWTAISAATLGAATAAVTVAASYEASFAQVLRTTDVTKQEADELREAIEGLGASIPSSFGQLTEIAALGGQMNIAASGLEEFTRITAELEATSDLTAEAAGKMLGSFQALLDVSPDNFERLASSLSLVAVNSVATDTEIVNIATQISSMGRFAGLTAEQVIGFAGALGSVRVPPELARGTVTQLFVRMSQAVSGTTDTLDDFARLAGVSAAEFQSAWRTEDFADILQGFFAGLGREGAAAEQSLRELGITTRRDVPIMLRLAGATDLVAEAFENSRRGWDENTEQARQFAEISNTLEARLRRLGNVLTNIIAGSGEEARDVLSELVAVILNTAQGFEQISKNPVFRVFSGLAVAVTAIVGAFTAFLSVQALTLASLLGMRTAMGALAGQGIQTTGIFRQFSATVKELIGVTTIATSSQTAYNASLQAGSGRIVALASGLRAAAGASTALGTALKGALVTSGIGIALVAIGSAVHAMGKETQDAKAHVDALTESLNAQTGAITELSQQTVFAKLVEDGTIERAKELGISLDLVRDAIFGDGEAIAFLRGELDGLLGEWEKLSPGPGRVLSDEELARFNELRTLIPQLKVFLADLGIQIDAVADSQENWGEKNEFLGDELDKLGDDVDTLNSELKELIDTYYGATDSTVALNNSLASLGASLAENGAEFGAHSVEGRANLQALQSVVDNMAKSSSLEEFANKIAGLMQSLGAMGVNVAKDLSFLQGILSNLAGQGVTPDFFTTAQASLDASRAINQGYVPAMQKAAQSSRKAAESANKMKKEVRTLTDYVNDLGKVFNDAFNFRYGLDQSIDSVADAYQRLIDYADSAAEAVRKAAQDIVDADARIKGLQAASSTLTYQLMVAQEYGDTLRANEILAEMAENQASLRKEEDTRAKAQKDLQKAQDATSKSLDGGTEASREQRSQMLDLVKAYQDQVIALANTGISQKELETRTRALRDQFVAQVTQLGYNRTEIGKYAATFDGLVTAIQKVPKNLTMNANADPALRAVDELKARIDRATNNGKGYNIPISSSFSGNTRKMDAFFEMQEALRQMQRFQGLGDESSFTTWQNRYWAAQRKYNQFYEGGFTGRGGKYEPKGIVHGGEYVIPKHLVNQRTGVPYPHALDGLGSLSRPNTTNYYNGGYVRGQQNNNIQLVELLPNQLRQLATMVSSDIRVDGSVLARATNNANANASWRGSN